MTEPDGAAAEQAEDWCQIVAASAHTMCDRGLTWGKDAGDSSVRDPDTGLIYILPQPSDQLHIPSWDVITSEHIAVVDIDGNTVKHERPGADRRAAHRHLRIYQHRPDVHAVVHSHGRWSRVYAALRQPIPALMIDSFLYTGATQIQCTEFGAIGSDEVAMGARYTVHGRRREGSAAGGPRRGVRGHVDGGGDGRGVHHRGHGPAGDPQLDGGSGGAAVHR